MRKNINILLGNDGVLRFLNPINSRIPVKEEYDKSIDIKRLQGRRINLIIEGKELLIEEMLIPRTRKAYVENLVENALLQRFPSLNEIAFDFKVIKKERTQLRVLVYCINLGNLILLEKENFQGVKIQSVKAIQQVYGEFFKKQIKKKDFCGIWVFKNYFYFIYVRNNILYENKAEEFNHIDEITEFIESINYHKDLKQILYILEDYNIRGIEKVVSHIKGISIINLTEEKKSKKIIKYKGSWVEV